MPNLKIRWEDLINAPILNSNFIGEINIWGGGNYSFCFILKREDNWYTLPRKFPKLKEIENDNNHINILGRELISEKKSKEFKLKIVFNKNSKNNYNSLDLNWNNGKKNGCLWLKIYNSDTEIIKRDLNIEEDTIELNNSLTCTVQLPKEIINHNDLNIAFGVFWSKENDTWPTSNIINDAIENNYINYGAECEIAIEYLSILYYQS